MFIKTIVKTDKSTQKVYEYLRLCESYRLGTKTRHNTIVSLGLQPYLDSKEKKKDLADRIEMLLIGNSSLFMEESDTEIERLAHYFYEKILTKKIISEDSVSFSKVTNDSIDDIQVSDFRSIDINSIENENVREIGSEWLCYQAIQQLEIPSFLEKQGWNKKSIQRGLIHIVSKSVYPCSEHKSAYWIQNNSDVASLFGTESQKITRHHLYDISKKLYQTKPEMEAYLSKKTNDLFDIEDKIVLYDLTNTYFEGRKENSELAKFGRSKEKRSDAKLLSLALVTNAEGFVKYSKIYAGNISEPGTLLETIQALSAATSELDRKPLIVLDAAFSTNENKTMLKKNGFEYLTVTLSKLKKYSVIDSDKPEVNLVDNRGNKIQTKFVAKKKSKKVADRINDDDAFLYIRSEKKAQKEAAMDSRFSLKFAEEINNLADGLLRKKGTKSIEKISERIGRIRQKYTFASKLYDIKLEQKENIVTAIHLSKKAIELRPEDGVYFICTSKKDLTEKGIWTIYNTLTEIEATFRTLKTDLSIRPVHHQTDQNAEAHIYMGILAYQVVATIRHQLKAKNINDSWQTILLKMSTQKSVVTSMLDSENNKITIKNCSQASSDAKAIYKALNYKEKPFNKKHIVFP